MWKSPLKISSFLAMGLSTSLLGGFVALNSNFPTFWGVVSVSMVLLLLYNYIGAVKLEDSPDLLKGMKFPIIEKILRVVILVALQALLGIMLIRFIKIESGKIIARAEMFGFFLFVINILYLVWDVLIRVLRAPKKTFYYFLWNDILICIGAIFILFAKDIKPDEGGAAVVYTLGGPVIILISIILSGYQAGIARFCLKHFTMSTNSKLDKIVLSVLFVLICFAGITSYLVYKQKQQSPDRLSSDRLSIGIATWPGFATGYVGMEKGFFGKDLIVTTRILDNMPARHTVFQSGDIDIMISSVDGYAQEAGQGIAGKVILITDESWGGDGIVCSEDIKSLTDLKGKKIAFARATPSHYLLLKILDEAGIALSDAQLIEVDDPGRAGDAFLGGAVDAAVTWEPFLSQVVKSGKGHILLTTKDYPDIIVDILVASDKLAANEDLLKRFMDGWLKSVDYIKAHPKEAAQIMSKGLNVPAEDVEGMMTGLRYADRERNAHFFDSAQPGQTRLASIFNDAGKYWQEVKIIEKPIPAASRISPTAFKYFQGKP